MSDCHSAIMGSIPVHLGAGAVVQWCACVRRTQRRGFDTHRRLLGVNDGMAERVRQ